MKNAKTIKKVSFRHSLIFSAMLSVSAATAQASGLEQSVQFNIPAQSLNAALLAFSEQSGLQVSVQSESLEGYTSAGISGEQSSQQVLNSLLQETGLVYTLVGEDTVAITKSGGVVTQQKADSGRSKSVNTKPSNNHQ